MVACGSSSKTNNPAQDLANQIKNKDVALIAGSNTDTSNAATNKAIKDAVQTNNKLKSDQMKNITITKVTLKDNEQANTVKANIKIGKDTASVNLNVEIHSTAAQIKTKIDNVGRLYATIVNADTSDNKLSQKNIDMILPIVKANNPQLSTFDQKQLSIDVSTSTTLTTGRRVDVTLKITSDTAIKTDTTTTLKVARFVSATGATEDQYKADKIADKVGASLVTAIVTGSNTSVTNNTTRDALRAALVKDNTVTKLNSTEAGKITFGTAGVALATAETDNVVTATITEGSDTDTVTLTKVQINSTAAEIKTKLGSGRLNAAIVNTNKADDKLSQTNIDKILSIFKANNAQLSTYDLDQLSIDVSTSTTLTLDTSVNVTLKIKDGASGTDTTTLKVARFIADTSNKYKAFAIQDKIAADSIVAIKAGSSTTFATSKAAIKTALGEANPTLTADDLKTITLTSAGALTAAEADNAVTATINVGTGSSAASANVSLTKVQIHRTATEIKTIIDALTSNALTILGSSGTTGVGNTNQRIKTALKTAKSALTTWDLSQITIPANENITSSGVAFTFTIKDDNSGTATSASTTVSSTS